MIEKLAKPKFKSSSFKVIDVLAFPSSVNAVPILADCEPETGNIDPESIEKNIGKKTKALVITHLCGHPCDMDKILKIV